MPVNIITTAPGVDFISPDTPTVGPSVASRRPTEIDLGMPVSPAYDHKYYEVYRSENDVDFTLVGTAVDSNPAFQVFTDPGPLGADTTYYYALVDVDRSENSSARGPSVATSVINVGATVALASASGYGATISYPSQTDNILYLGAAATGNGLGGDVSNVCTWATVAGIVQNSTTVYVLDEDYSGQVITFTNIIATQSDPIIFKAFTTTPTLKGNDSANSISREVVRLTDCEYVSFEDVNIDGSRSSGDQRHPRWTIKSWAYFQNCSYCEWTDSTFSRCNGFNGFTLQGTTTHSALRRNTFEYCGDPDVWTDATPGNADGFSSAQFDRGDAIVSTNTTSFNTIEDNTIRYSGHAPMSIYGYRNVTRRITITNKWPETINDGIDNKYPTPWPVDHPYSAAGAEEDRSFLAGFPRGNRAGGMRGASDWTGRNLFEDITVTDLAEGLDSGQIFRVTGYRQIIRFNQFQKSSSRGGVDITAGIQPDRQVAECEFYNNEFVEMEGFNKSPVNDKWMIRVSSQAAVRACGFNKIYNNAFGALPASSDRMLNIYHAQWAADPYPNYPAGGVTSEWGNNIYANNSHVDALTDLDFAGDISGNLQTVEADGTGGQYVFGNTGGSLYSSSIRPHALTVGSGAGVTSFTIDNPYPFVAPNNYTQLGSGEGDEVVINGTRTRILTLNESTGAVTVDTAVSFSSGDAVYHGRAVAADNVTTSTGTDNEVEEFYVIGHDADALINLESGVLQDQAWVLSNPSPGQSLFYIQAKGDVGANASTRPISLVPGAGIAGNTALAIGSRDANDGPASAWILKGISGTAGFPYHSTIPWGEFGLPRGIRANRLEFDVKFPDGYLDTIDGSVGSYNASYGTYQNSPDDILNNGVQESNNWHTYFAPFIRFDTMTNGWHHVVLGEQNSVQRAVSGNGPMFGIARGHGNLWEIMNDFYFDLATPYGLFDPGVAFPHDVLLDNVKYTWVDEPHNMDVSIDNHICGHQIDVQAGTAYQFTVNFQNVSGGAISGVWHIYSLDSAHLTTAEYQGGASIATNEAVSFSTGETKIVDVTLTFTGAATQEITMGIQFISDSEINGFPPDVNISGSTPFWQQRSHYSEGFPKLDGNKSYPAHIRIDAGATPTTTPPDVYGGHIATVIEGESVNIPLGAKSITGSPLTYNTTDAPSYGTASYSVGNLVYTATTPTSEVDFVGYTVSDINGTSQRKVAWIKRGTTNGIFNDMDYVTPGDDG